MSAPRRRLALSTLAGVAPAKGGDASSAILAHALALAGDPEAARAGLHGWHPYAARMHPLLARTIVRLLSPEKGAVLDPFCGSGTVLVEARVAGRRAFGVDVNPLAVRLARTLAGAIDLDMIRTLPALAADVATKASAKGAPARGPARRGEASFDPHVFRELAGLWAAIDRVTPPARRELLELGLSAILIKVSRRTAETRDETTPKKLARGFASRLFVDRIAALAAGLETLAKETPAGTSPPRVEEGDARKLPFPDGSVDLVLTSPPYLGTYDYVEHQRLRYDWLGLDDRFAGAHEMGARRRGVGPAAIESFVADLSLALREARRVLRPNGRIVIEMGDSAPVARRAIASRPLVERALARAGGLRLVAWASAERRPPGRSVPSGDRPAGSPRSRQPAPEVRPAILEHLLLLLP